MSRRAPGERTILRRPRFSGTRLAGGDFLSDAMDVLFQIVHRFKLDSFASVDGIKAFFCGHAQPVEFGRVFLFALFEEPEAFADNFAGVAEASGSYAGFDEAIKSRCQVDVSRWHPDGRSEFRLAFLPRTPNWLRADSGVGSAVLSDGGAGGMGGSE